MPNTTTPAQYILILIDMVEQQGCDPKRLLAGTPFADTGISTIGARIPDADFTQLVSNAQALTGDPALGLKLGLRLNLSAHAVLGQAVHVGRAAQLASIGAHRVDPLLVGDDHQDVGLAH